MKGQKRRVVGHARHRDVLARALAAGRVPQTLLFSGPKGVGKFATALALARGVNCANASAGVACDACVTCDRIFAGQFSDVVVVDRGDYASISIKVVREKVLALIGYRPFEGRKRVFIVDGADDLTWEAQDSLLKTLEEPPPGAMLILVAESADALKATVLSRCRRLRFSALTESDVALVLTEQLGMDAASARSRAAVAGGSVSRALEIDGGSLEEDREAAVRLLESGAGTAMAPKLKAATAFVTHEKKRRSREAVGARLDHLASLLRDLSARTGDIEPANPDLAETLERIVRAFPPDRIIDAFALVARARWALDRNASPKIVADWVAVGI